MTQPKKTHTSSGAVVYKKNSTGNREYLIMFRTSTGTCHLPKGTQESGETLEQTADREVLEETGVRIEREVYLNSLPSTFKHCGQVIEKTTHYYLARTASISVSEPDQEHDVITFLPYHLAQHCLKQLTWKEEEWHVLEKAEEILNARDSSSI